VSRAESDTEVGGVKSAITVATILTVSVLIAFLVVEQAAGWSTVEALGSHMTAFVLGVIGGVTLTGLLFLGEQS